MACKTITIFSNKGGVGKTFVTVNLATALALAGRKVLLIDMDSQGGQDMARTLNLSPRYSIVDIFELLNKPDDAASIKAHVLHHTSGVDFIPATRTPRQSGLLTPDNIRPFLKRAASLYDFILIDSGKSFTETLITVLDYSNLILLVATPDILAVYQVKWCLDFLQNLQFPLKMVKLILNRSESRGSVAWQEIRAVLPCEIFSHIPSDGKIVGLALNKGIPCVIDSPRSPVADAFNKMVHILQREDIYVASPENTKPRNIEAAEDPNKFWEKFGVKQTGASSVVSPRGEDDEIGALKRKLHEKLVQRLNIDGITIDTLSDPKKIASVKKTAEEVVANLLMEETGGKITAHEQRVKIVHDVVNEALGLGPLEEYLADPDVSDIMVNNRNEIYVEKNGKLILTNQRFISDEKVRSVIERIIAPLGRRIDESTPMVDARLPDGSRINAIIPPLSLNGPMITIRKFGKERIVINDLLEKFQSLTNDMAGFLKACVVSRENIIVSGGTGAGKTTLLNVISEFIPDGERILTIEDAAELRLKKSHWGRLESRPMNIEGRGQVTIRDLFVNSLRMRPDRIIIGECRGAEALDMLQAMNTGHDGSMTTLHANSTRDVLTRLHSMILLSGIELPVRAINEMVSSAINIIVQINRFSDGTRKITGIAEITGISHDFQLQLQDVFVFRQKGLDNDGKVIGDYEPTGYIPKCYDEFATRGIPLSKDIFTKPS